MLVLKQEMLELNEKARSTNQQVLFATVGRALTSWSKMEEPIVIIASHLLRISPEKAGAIFYSINSPRNWFSIISDLFEMDHVLIRHKPKFNKLAKRVGDEIDIRNQLAHHSIEMAKVHIKPSILDGRTKSKGQSPLSAEQVSAFTDKVLTLAEELHELQKAMASTLESWPEKSA